MRLLKKALVRELLDGTRAAGAEKLLKGGCCSDIELNHTRDRLVATVANEAMTRAYSVCVPLGGLIKASNFGTCSCADFLRRGLCCKHIAAVFLTLLRGGRGPVCLALADSDVAATSALPTPSSVVANELRSLKARLSIAEARAARAESRLATATPSSSGTIASKSGVGVCLAFGSPIDLLPRILEAVAAAESFIYLCAYTFDLGGAFAALAEALVSARERLLDVRIVVDRGWAYSRREAG